MGVLRAFAPFWITSPTMAVTFLTFLIFTYQFPFDWTGNIYSMAGPVLPALFFGMFLVLMAVIAYDFGVVIRGKIENTELRVHPDFDDGYGLSFTVESGMGLLFWGIASIPVNLFLPKLFQLFVLQIAAGFMVLTAHIVHVPFTPHENVVVGLASKMSFKELKKAYNTFREELRS